MSSVNSVNPSATDLGDMDIKARGGRALMDSLLAQSSSASTPSKNDIAQEYKNGVAATAAASSGSATSTKTPSKNDLAQENKNGVAAKAAAGSTASSNASSGTDTIDYAAVHMENLKGQLHNAQYEPAGPARDAKVNQLKTEIAAAQTNTSTSSSTAKSGSTSTDNSTASKVTTSSDAKSVKSKLEAEIKELENEYAISADSAAKSKLDNLYRDLNFVNGLVKSDASDIEVSTV